MTFDALRDDVRFSLRLMRRERAAAGAIILCLAIGIGATTAVFSAANGLLLKSLPFPNGDRIVVVATTNAGVVGSGTASLPDFNDWRARQRAFAAMAGYTNGLVTVIDEPVVRIPSVLVRGDFFETLGVRPHAGRFLTTEDMSDAAGRVVVVAERFAAERFGSADAAVGKLLRLEDASYRVVGVLRATHRFPERGEVWLPIRRALREERSSRFLRVVATLRPGVSLAQAQGDLDRIASALAREYPADNASTGIRATPLRDRYIGTGGRALVVIAIAALLVLGVACANIASLQLSRGASRVRELAVRTAIGASQSRLVRQLLVESLMLAIVGAALGVALAVAASGALAAAIAADVPPWMTFAPDYTVMLFTATVAGAAAIASGLVPALRLVRTTDDAVTSLRSGGRGGLDRTTRRIQRGIIAAEVAASLALLVGAALAALSARHLLRIDPGYETAGMLTFRVGVRGDRYAAAPARAAFSADVLREIAATPGVEVAAAATVFPIRECCTRVRVGIDGQTLGQAIPVNQVSAEYFRTLAIPLRRGRTFNEADDLRAAQVAVVGETFAKRFWPSLDPIGRRIHIDTTWSTVVGVVADVKLAALSDEAEPQVYRPLAQEPRSNMTVAVRSAREPGGNPPDPNALIPAVRAAVRRVLPLSPITDVAAMSEVIDGSIARQRLYGVLFVVFAISAGLLAAVGLQSMLAYHVTRRHAEFGIRAALGAEPSHIRSLVIREGATVVVIGMAIGAVASIALMRLLTHAMFGVRPDDPIPYLAVAVFMGASAGIATLVPAMRAGRVSPLEAMRAE